MPNVCSKCFDDQGLRRRINELANIEGEECDFHPGEPGKSLQEVATIVDEVFRRSYEIGDYWGDEQKGDPLSYTLQELTETDLNQVADALAAQLIADEYIGHHDADVGFYQSDQCYSRLHGPTGSEHSELWAQFCKSIVHRRRFFNDGALELVAQIFDDIHLQSDSSKRRPVSELVPGTPEAVFLRARIATSDEEANGFVGRPATELGPPPDRRRRAGRMNPAGIATFYGAYDIDTCLAELRPVVGSTIVTAQFRLMRPIYALDTTRFQKPIRRQSPFAKGYLKRLDQWNFMQDFMREISQPIKPDDEHLDYIPTQAVAEYLLHHSNFERSGTPGRIEAIIYRSAQNPKGRNIALLGDAARVHSMEPPTKQPQKWQREPMSWFDGRINLNIAVKPALEVVAGSAQKHRVTGARYLSAQSTGALFHDDNDDF